MPQAASDIAGADYTVSAAKLAPLLVKLVGQPVAPPEASAGAGEPKPAEKITQHDLQTQVKDERNGQISVFTCPDCGGIMWEMDEAGSPQFRCHLGHQYKAGVLLDKQTTALEAALWSAVRTFREKEVLSRQLAGRDRAAGRNTTADEFDEAARQAERYGNLIREYILKPAAQKNRPPPGDAGGRLAEPKEN
jgi:two-component system chemotaxis response regulator CheB